MYRYAKNFAGNNELEPGVGADRLIGLTGIVTSPIDPDDTERRGRVTANGEIWGATSQNGTAITAGAHVRIVAVSGTKVIVESTDVTPPSAPPGTPPTAPPPPSSPPAPPTST